jgi:hypothetical protein
MCPAAPIRADVMTGTSPTKTAKERGRPFITETGAAAGNLSSENALTRRRPDPGGATGRRVLLSGIMIARNERLR